MKLVQLEDPREFKKLAFPFLMQNEAVNCIALGVIQSLIAGDKKWDNSCFGTVVEGSNILGTFTQSPPYPFNLSTMPVECIPLLIEFASGLSPRPTGVLSRPEIVEGFKGLWFDRVTAKEKSLMRQGIFQLNELILPKKVEGQMISINPYHRDLLLNWNRSFLHDCGLGFEINPEKEKAVLDEVIQSQSRVLWIQGGNPVAMAGAQGKTPNGIRIGWVYTPPEHRGRGYASNLVAQLTDRLLKEGNKFCFLNTDLSNSTSNKIYQKMGYRQVGEACHSEFEY